MNEDDKLIFEQLRETWLRFAAWRERIFAGYLTVLAALGYAFSKNPSIPIRSAAFAFGSWCPRCSAFSISEPLGRSTCARGSDAISSKAEVLPRNRQGPFYRVEGDDLRICDKYARRWYRWSEHSWVGHLYFEMASHAELFGGLLVVVCDCFPELDFSPTHRGMRHIRNMEA